MKFYIILQKYKNIKISYMKYLKEFDSISKIQKYYQSENFDIPNVLSYVDNNDNKQFDINGYESNEILCLYDIPDLTAETTFWAGRCAQYFEYISIDGAKWDDLANPPKYSDFNTKKHIVKIKFKNPSISTGPFLENDAVRSVYVPEYITYLGGGTFYNCNNIELFHCNLTGTLSPGFSLSQNVKKIIIGDNVTDINNGVFYGLNKIELIHIGENVKTLRSGAFTLGNKTHKVNKIYLGKNVNQIDPNSIPTLCENIEVSKENKNLYIPKNSNCIVDRNTQTLIWGCSKTIIPNFVKIIGTAAFMDCYNISSISIPNSVTTISASAFSQCENLESVSLPNSIETIYDTAFEYCPKLGYIENGIRYLDVNDTYGTMLLGIDDYTLETYNIKNSVKHWILPYYKWQSCTNLKSFVLPNSLISIKNDAFKGYELILTKEQANTILSINENAFNKDIIHILYSPRSYFTNKNLTILVLENGTINIERQVYSGSYVYYKKNGSTTETAIKGSISVSKNDTIEFYTNSDKKILSSMSLNFDAYICGNLSSIIGNLTNFNFRDFFKNSTSSYLNIDKLILPNISNCVVDQYSIVGPFTSLFENCVGIKSIPEDLLPFTTLKPYCYANMFKGCTGLTSIPENLLPANSIQKSSYEGMFANCTNLSDVPENLLINMKWLNTGSCQYMFYGCTSLVKAPTIYELNSSITNQCSYMFQGCTSLNYIKNLGYYVSACYKDWVKGVSSSGTFVKNSNVTTWPTGDSGIPEGWTVEDYVES